jgi:hypothetical protein
MSAPPRPKSGAYGGVRSRRDHGLPQARAEEEAGGETGERRGAHYEPWK